MNETEEILLVAFLVSVLFGAWCWLWWISGKIHRENAIALHAAKKCGDDCPYCGA